MAQTREEQLAKRRAWYAINGDVARAKGRVYMRERRASDPELGRVESRRSNAKRHLTVKGRASALFNAARRRARLKGLPFDLTKKWVETRIADGCELTGFAFVLDQGRGAGNRHAFAPSVDRRSLSAGYVQENCRVIVWCLNAALSTWGETDLLAAVSAWATRRV